MKECAGVRPIAAFIRNEVVKAHMKLFRNCILEFRTNDFDMLPPNRIVLSRRFPIMIPGLGASHIQQTKLPTVLQTIRHEIH